MADHDTLKLYREELRDFYKTTWAEFMKWYIFFCGFNLTGLGASGFQKAVLGPLAVAFVPMDLLAAATCAYMAVYSYRVSRHLDATYGLLLKLNPSDAKIPEPYSFGTTPMGFTVFSGVATSLTLTFLLCVWVSLARGVPTP